MTKSSAKSIDKGRIAVCRIVIVDDHPLVREGLKLRISMEPDLEVCGEADCEVEAVHLIQNTLPDLAVVDLSLKSGHGIEVIKQVKSRFPGVHLLVLTGHEESLFAQRALKAGASGYLHKQDSSENLIKAIRTVLSGERYLSQDLSQQLIKQALGDKQGAGNPLECLSDRELQIFQLIGQGLTSGTIAERLFISTHTIDTHRENIKRKLQVKNGAELTRRAVQWMIEGK